MTDRAVSFDAAEMERIHAAARALNTSQREFVHVATMHAADEVLGLSAAVRREQLPDDPRRAELRKLVEVATEARSAHAAWIAVPVPADPEADEWGKWYELQDAADSADDVWRTLYREWSVKDASDEASLQRLLADVVGPLL